MALVPYEGKEDFRRRSNRSRLTRLFSSPFRKQIIHNEVYSSGGNTFMKSYSFDQSFNRDDTGRTFETTQIQVLSFVTPEKSIPAKCNKTVKRRHRLKNRLMSHDPAMAIDAGSQTQDSKGQLKRMDKKWKIAWLVLGNSVWCFILAVACFYSIVRECFYVWDLNELSRDLKENVFGQNEAINKVDSVLSLYNKTRDLQTVVLTGGVGVGKSLTSSIISRNFPWTSNRLIIKHSRGGSIEQQLPHSFSNCGCNLIRVDDLGLGDVDMAVNLISTVRSKMKNERVFLILLFRTQTEEERGEVLSKLKESDVSAVHIPFNSLNRDMIKQCYQYEIKKQGAQISNVEVEKLIDNKMKHIDIVGGSVGCKGVSEEVSFFIPQN